MNRPLPGDHNGMAVSPRLKRNLLAVLILLIAFALRIIALDTLPPGLSHDEAYNGVTAIDVLEGQRRIFFEINKGIEPLIIYLEAVAFSFFGIRPISLRLVNVFCGLLTVVLVYPVAARLFNRRVALLAMAGIAISFWAIFVSRLTLRAVTLPPLLLLTLYFFWRGLKSSSRPGQFWLPYTFFVLSGLTAGVTMYTYLSSRFLPFILVGIFGYQLLRGQIRRLHWLGLLLTLGLLTLIFTPLAAYYWQNADSFTRRADQVTTIPHLMNGEVGPTLESTFLTLGMFTFRGDETDRYNLDQRPLFDWLNGFFFYAGLIILLLRLPRSPDVAGPAALLFIWGFFMLLPDFITDDSPHFLRTIGALPVVYIGWAVGLDYFVDRLRPPVPPTGGEKTKLASDGRVKYVRSNPPDQKTTVPPFGGLGGRIVPIAILLLLFFTTLHTGYDYFWRWATAPEARYIYGADIAAIARQLKQETEGDFPAISAEYYRDLDPFRLTLHFQGQPPFAIWFDGRQSFAFPPPESGLEPSYFFSMSAPVAPPWQPFLEEMEATTTDNSYTLYHLPDAAALNAAWLSTFPSENSLNVNVNDDLLLLGYQTQGRIESGGQLELLLGWQALRRLPPGADYTFLVRLRDRQGHIWVETDGNGYAPGDWQPGVRAMQRLTLRLPADLPPRLFDLTVEVVDRRQRTSLPTAGGETVVTLETLPGQLAETPGQIEAERLPNPTPITATVPSAALEPQIALRGYQLDRRTARPSEALSLIFHWQVLQPPNHDYHLEFFLVDTENDPETPAYALARLDPMAGEWPTSRWPAAYWLQDRLTLPIPAEVPSGSFKLRGRWMGQDVGHMESPFFELGRVTLAVE